MTLSPIRKTTLLHSCAGAALLASLAFASGSASAQGINATGTVVQGSAQIDNMVPGTTLVTVDTQDTVIDWDPDIDPTLGVAETFLPFGNTAIFQNGSNNTNFAVLNRIMPGPGGNPALFQGLVQAFLNDLVTGAQTPGGFVAFYSPTGIIVGPTGRFEVPQLMLTTQAVDISTISNFANGTGAILLNGNTGSIDLQAGSTFVGTPEDSFLIVASPQINMAGDAFYNGSIAYVASTSVQMTHSSGLFDIIIVGGVGGGQVITHTGSSGGPSSTGAGDEHVIYGVTQGAIGGGGVSMLFSGNLGFQPAASAAVVNGDIILSANYNVFGRTVDGDDNRQGADSFFDGRSQVPGVSGDILLEGITATSNFLAIASDQVNLDATGASSSFSADLSLVGRTQAVINAANGNDVTVDGDLFVSARNYGLITQGNIGIDATGGFASVRAGVDSGIIVLGETMVAASALPGFDFFTNTAGAGTGGQAQILAEGGFIDLQGNVRMESYARFDPGAFSFPPSGYGAMQGGQVQFLATEDGGLNTLGSLTIDASAEGPSIDAADASLASNVTGGNITVGVGTNSGSVSIAGDVSASANANILTQAFATGTGPFANGGTVNFSVIDLGTLTMGGNVSGTANAFIGAITGGGSAGSASGGSAVLSAIGGDIDITGSLSLAALGQGGDGEIGGDAFGGDANILVNNGNVSIGGTTSASADSTGGTGASDGGNGNGGNASIVVSGGSLTTTGQTTVSASGSGALGAAGGDGTGGIGFLGVDNGGTWTANGIFANTNGFAAPGQDGDGGFAAGGELSIFLGNGGTLNLTGFSNFSSTGAAAGGDTTSGDGVSAAGGSVSLTVDNATLNGATATLDMIASATGGAVDTAGFTGGSASGGDVSIAIQNGGTASLNLLGVESRGTGGNGVDGSSGGGADGGSVDVLVDGTGSDLTTADDFIITTRADGGDTTSAGINGGTADGGTIGVSVSNGANVDIGGQFDGRTSALGGVGPQGGDAFGGSATFTATDSNVTIGDDFSLQSDAGSGFDPSGTGAGGNATGGDASLLIDNSTFTASNSTGALDADAIAGGSAGAGVGGDATGGTTLVDISNGSVVDLGVDFGLFALAVTGGSNGGDGGDGIGGDNRMLISGGSDVTVGQLIYETTVTGNNGATGGNATGGSNLLDISGSDFTSNELIMFAAVVTRPDNAVGTGGSAIVRLSDGAQASFGDTYLEAFAEAVGANATSNSGSIIIETVGGGLPSFATFGSTEFFNDALGGVTNTAGLIQVNAVNGELDFTELLITNLGNVANATPSQITADNGAVRIVDLLDFVSFGDIVFTYANDGTILGGVGPDSLTALFNVTATDGTIFIDGDSTIIRSFGAQTLNLTSDDIEVGADTRFGGNDVNLTSTDTDNAALIGGTTAGAGYTLLADEAVAIDGINLTILLPGVTSATVDAVVDDVTFLGSGGQRFANINLFVDGSLDIIGALNFSSLLSGDTLNIAVEQNVRIVLPTGSINLDDGGSGIAGDLLISGTSFAAADPGLLATIAADPADPTIAAALLDDGGAAAASSYISAGRVEISMLDYIFGQNTGANGVYGGITVGGGGLLITQQTGAPALLNVIAFGLRDDGTGQLTNSDFFFVVEYATDLAGTYFADATFNNCVIVTQTCPTTPVDPVDPVIDIPITNQILVEQPVRPKQNIEEGAMTDSQFGFDFPSLLDAPLISEDEVIRDPVTSGTDSAVHALGLIPDEEREEEEEGAE
ncbi:beta strand repeat-containing protein [Aurantiacibacter sp. D1-12]|uniref:beta strand repeat-containing protein n=1 Tax=Aurantiacibacter sp. D1-12 TaxID=2993658 RepID=UPI00237C8B61|nr:hypothetical protein [Aurantiacibacter sp. D1-12]MDE1467287.1 hypothetical protein [Aurantiacibacter sp. D1-12]